MFLPSVSRVLKLLLQRDDDDGYWRVLSERVRGRTQWLTNCIGVAPSWSYDQFVYLLLTGNLPDTPGWLSLDCARLHCGLEETCSGYVASITAVTADHVGFLDGEDDNVVPWVESAFEIITGCCGGVDRRRGDEYACHCWLFHFRAHMSVCDLDSLVNDGGTYTLVVAVPERTTIEVGALGPLPFDAGWYAYVGSATGPGGFSRIARHRELAAGERGVRHWHIDYLLGHSETRIDTVERTNIEGECAVARAIRGESVAKFGCSDCDCRSHLFFRSRRDSLLESVEQAHEKLRR